MHIKQHGWGEAEELEAAAAVNSMSFLSTHYLLVYIVLHSDKCEL